MATSLRHNLTSAYLDAAHKFSSKKGRRRIVAYVESYDDIAFWRTLLAEFENEGRYVQVMLPSATSLAKGKKMVLMNTLNTFTELGRSLIACVDSDYDFLLQGATNVWRKINRNPYIFQTYGYAIENFHCFAESLHEVCVQATLNDRYILDFPRFPEALFTNRLSVVPMECVVLPAALIRTRFPCMTSTTMSVFRKCVRIMLPVEPHIP